MASIRTLNLLYERRIRGTYPVSRYALDNAGNLTLAVPRPLEARSYDLTRVAKDGGNRGTRRFLCGNLAGVGSHGANHQLFGRDGG